MKSKIIIPVLLLSVCFLSSCGPSAKNNNFDETKPFITIIFSFNPESYPRIIKKAYPQIAVWASQKEMKINETLYATESGAKDKWWGAETRPASLPVWYGIRNKNTVQSIDTVTGPTPSGESFEIHWNIPDRLQGAEIEVFIEANVSFDYNNHYPEKAKEGDPGYSDVNGQPSLIWKAVIKTRAGSQAIEPKIIGHGHILGSDHNIYADLSKITTANGLFNYVKVIYESSGPGSEK